MHKTGIGNVKRLQLLIEAAVSNNTLDMTARDDGDLGETEAAPTHQPHHLPRAIASGDHQ